jgi:hypothetical protein
MFAAIPLGRSQGKLIFYQEAPDLLRKSEYEFRRMVSSPQSLPDVHKQNSVKPAEGIERKFQNNIIIK